MRKLFTLLIIPILLLAGCGGGGGASVNNSATEAKVTLSTQGTIPTGRALAGIGVTLQLPAGVTPKLDASGGVDSSVVTPSGVLANGATVLTPVYIPASGTTPGSLSFAMASSAATGFGSGEFATVKLKVAAGTTAPTQSDYQVPTATPIDLTGARVSSLSVVFAAELL